MRRGGRGREYGDACGVCVRCMRAVCVYVDTRRVCTEGVYGVSTRGGRAHSNVL